MSPSKNYTAAHGNLGRSTDDSSSSSDSDNPCAEVAAEQYDKLGKGMSMNRIRRTSTDACSKV